MAVAGVRAWIACELLMTAVRLVVACVQIRVSGFMFYILANPGICICRTISLILQDFACFCRTNAILHGSASRREFRHPESQIFTTSYKAQWFLLHRGCHWLAHSLGNGSALLTHWHPSCGWHWSWPATL